MYERKAYGAHRQMSPAVKARNVAESIVARESEGRSWEWSDYGLTIESPTAQMVKELRRQWCRAHE
jgi:hypothetical protein